MSLHIPVQFLIISFLPLQAAKALTLCCKASWNRVLCLCELFKHESDKFQHDLSEDDVIGFIDEACEKTAFLLEVLQYSGDCKVQKILIDSLKIWSAAQHLFKKLPSPISVVKQFVKVKSKALFVCLSYHPSLCSSENYICLSGFLLMNFFDVDLLSDGIES